MESLNKIGFICFFFLSLSIYAQEDEVLWTPELKLRWEDFKGKPDPNSRIAAVTASGISYKFSSMERNGYYEVEYTADTFFYPKQSWYQPHMCDDIILSHEQLHFDISELYARKMRKIMDGTRFTENVKLEVKEIYRQVLKELAAFQDKYDEETNFSRNREAQLRWNREIKAALGK